MNEAKHVSCWARGDYVHFKPAVFIVTADLYTGRAWAMRHVRYERSSNLFWVAARSGLTEEKLNSYLKWDRKHCWNNTVTR